MCEASVYMLGKDGSEKLVLDSVDKIIPSGDELLMENIYSQRKIVKGRIKEMSLVDHKIILEENCD
ncbi:MAG: CooT family nickel-binding protein [Pseudomonadota bacterium]